MEKAQRVFVSNGVGELCRLSPPLTDPPAGPWGNRDGVNVRQGWDFYRRHLMRLPCPPAWGCLPVLQLCLSPACNRCLNAGGSNFMAKPLRFSLPLPPGLPPFPSLVKQLAL